MCDKKYTISTFSKIFDQSKQVVRRRIDSLHIEPINRNTREFPNEPLQYDSEAYKKLADSFGVPVEESISDDDTRQGAMIHDDDTQNGSNKEQIIEILERELQHSKEKLIKAEEEKEQLHHLLNQQQQLSLKDRNKVEALEIELKDFEETNEIQEQTKNKKGFWHRLFK